MTDCPRTTVLGYRESLGFKAMAWLGRTRAEIEARGLQDNGLRFSVEFPAASGCASCHNARPDIGIRYSLIKVRARARVLAVEKSSQVTRSLLLD